MIFEDRYEAGRQLATELMKVKAVQPVILAVPRGGVPVAFEIANVLHAPFSVIAVRKIGAPHNPEYGIGAIAEGNVQVLDKHAIKVLDISKEEVKKFIQKEKTELDRRIVLYRNNLSLPLLRDKTVIVVDDGLATGVTARAAITAVKKLKPRYVIFASPICASETVPALKHLVDSMVCTYTSEKLESVGLWYKNFEQVTDEKVSELLRKNEKKVAEEVEDTCVFLAGF